MLFIFRFVSSGYLFVFLCFFPQSVKHIGAIYSSVANSLVSKYGVSIVYMKEAHC